MSAPRPDRLSPTRVVSHLAVMGVVAVVLGIVVGVLAVPFVGALGIGAKDLAKSMDELPANLETKPLAQQTQIVDAGGNVIATLYDENRVNVPLAQISRKMVESIVSIEDYRFYQHGALDLKGTLRALITNQASNGVVQGGSSITQQMVKMTLLNQAKTKAQRAAATADTYERKFKELRYAIAFEQHYSKDWILERYLNLAYFGDGAYGIQAAARHYFSVNAKDLTLRQSALLAGLVKNPTGYDPTNFPARALERRNVVLDRMAQLHVISDKQLNTAKKKGLGLHPTASSNGCVDSAAPWFCSYVVRYLEADPALGPTVKARKQLLYTGGLVIHTTLDMRFQKAADAAMRAHVRPTDPAIGAMAMIEPRTGNVKALSQSRPMGTNDKIGQTFLNYTVPTQYGDSGGFQGGSTFKIFVLAAAIMKGIPMTQQIMSPPHMTFQKQDFTTCGGKPYDYGSFPMNNSTTSGMKDMYTGTRESVNTFYLQLEEKTGLCLPYRLAKKMGVELTHPNPSRDGTGAERVATFTLGVANVSPLEMAEAYATMAGRGLHCDARPVVDIQDSSGQTVKSYPENCRQVIPSAVADAVNSVLAGVMQPGGFGQNLMLSVPSAGKTGTTQDNQAVWFDGYTPALATTMMIAGVKTNGIPDTLNGKIVGGVYVETAHGSTTAGPVWGEAMKAIQQWLPNIPFHAVAANQINGVQTSVPNVAGMSVQQATKVLTQAGFQVSVSGQVYSTYPAGTVAYTYPAGGGNASSGDTVTLYISNGQPPPKPKPHSGGGGGGGGGGKHNHGHGKG